MRNAHFGMFSKARTVPEFCVPNSPDEVVISWLNFNYSQISGGRLEIFSTPAKRTPIDIGVSPMRAGDVGKSDQSAFASTT